MPERMVRNASAHHLAVSFSHAALVLAQMPFTHSVHRGQPWVGGRGKSEFRPADVSVPVRTHR